MKVLILNGNPNPERFGLDSWLEGLTGELESAGHDVSQLRIRELDLHACTGCFHCWTKTPGICTLKDDGAEVCRGVVAADLVLFASPVIMGHVSALMRRANERFLPLLLPYIQVVEGECRHASRYDKRPKLGLVVEPGDATGEDLEIIRDTVGYTVKNFRTELAMFVNTNQSIGDVCHAINNN